MSVNLSFFAKKPLPVPPDGHFQRVTTIIRCYQIAQHIGAKINPTEGFEDDVCIYVKPPPSPDPIYTFEEKLRLGRGRTHLDICDLNNAFELARSYPEVPVISASDWNYQLLKRILPNKIINIPEQHCNFERIKKTAKGIKTVGCIGNFKAFPFLPEGLKESLKERNIELFEFSKFFTRQDIIDFYLKTDVQIIWRPYYDFKKDILVNPLKIVNASAFGVPTIAYDEPAFKQMNGCYMGVSDLKGFLKKLDELIGSPALYAEYSERCLKEAEKYHIDNISKLYLDLI